MKKFNELCAKVYFARQNAKEKVLSQLKNEKGGIDQYITMIMILIVVLVIGFLLYKWLGTGDNNVVFKWFKDQLNKVFGVDPQADSTVTQGS